MGFVREVTSEMGKLGGMAKIITMCPKGGRA